MFRTLATAYYREIKCSRIYCIYHTITNICDQALDLLVSVSSMHYCTSTPDLSTLSSTRGLTIL